MKIFAHLPQKPFHGRKILPKRSANESSALSPVVKVSPWRGKEDSPAFTFAQRWELVLDLARGQKIICVQILDVVAPAELKRILRAAAAPWFLLATILTDSDSNWHATASV